MRDDEWIAIRDILGGILPKSKRVQAMKRQERPATVKRMAARIYALQREVMAMLVGRWEATRKQREEMTLKHKEEGEKRKEEAKEKKRKAEEERRAEQQRIENEAEIDRVVGQLEKETQNADRRAEGRHGDKVATTRRGKRVNSTRDTTTVCGECMTALEDVCTSCVQKLTEMCGKCIHIGWRTDMWCEQCRRATRQMCITGCEQAITTMCGACRKAAPEHADAARKAKVRRRQTTGRTTHTTDRDQGSTSKGQQAQVMGNANGTKANVTDMEDPERWRRQTR